MDDKEIIARRVALELRSGDLVNLGIGLPAMVANYLPAGILAFFQSENGIVGMRPVPEVGMEDPYLTDAGGNFIGAIPGACSLDSALSFGLIRGGHLDITVLGGLQVDEDGRLANWVVPGKMVPGMGGAMDLVAGVKRVVVVMEHTAKDGTAKFKPQCDLPLTGVNVVDLLITDLAVFSRVARAAPFRLIELAPGVTAAEVRQKTTANYVE
jgi:acetate CoA/acetoacetate CoA-transferase beta subunit